MSIERSPGSTPASPLWPLVALLIATAGACSVFATDSGTFVLIGAWGGDHVRLDLGEDGGTLEYDCAHGTIAPGWTLTDEGRFSGTGEHFIEHGGPIREGEVIPPRPARYTGTVEGNRLHLTVVLTDSAQVVGTFDLDRDSEGSVFRCL